MRLMRTAFSGFLADADMLAYWRLRGQSTFNQPVADSSLSANRATNNRALVAGTTAPTGTDGFDPQIPNSAAQFEALGYFVSTSPMTSTERGALSSFGQAVAYDFKDRTVDGTILEFSGVSAPATNANGVRMNFSYRSVNNAFRLVFQRSTSTFVTHELAGCPSSGVIGFDLRPGGTQVDWYTNGEFAGTTTALTGTALAASSASSRWIVGGSVFTGSAYNTPSHLLTGKLSEIGLWRRPLGPEKHRELYASTVQPWDEAALYEAQNEVVKISAQFEDSAGNYQDLSYFDGADWVESVSIKEDVDSPEISCSVALRRRRGHFADLSPLNTAPDYANLIALRRNVKVFRSTVPEGWNLRGWERRLIFDGLIDSWDMSDETLDIKCTDKSAGIQDAFIVDTKAYQYATGGGTSVEVVQQQLLNEYLPRLGRSSDAVSIGYKGFSATVAPVLHTEAGTAAAPLTLPNPQVIRFNDVSSGPVMGALLALSDQTGYDLRFKYHDPWAAFRLTSSAPRRGLLIALTQIAQVTSNEAIVEFAVPHGLSDESRLNISGAAPYATGPYSVASVMDYYRVVIPTATLALSSITTVGTVSYDRVRTLNADTILSAENVKSDIDRIRNHVVIRYQRVDTTATFAATYVMRDVAGFLELGLDGRVGSIDPDNRGITFALTGATGGTGAAASLFGSYTGSVVGSRILASNVPSGVVGIAGDYPGTLPYSTPLIVSSQYVAFKEVISTATASLQQFGMLPVSIYEGSSLGIDTQAEADLLAGRLISDLSTPTVDLSITTRCLPLALHDVVILAQDPKGRWSGSLTAAITSVTETYDAGDCTTQYGLRRSVPSRGILWASRMMVSIERPAPPVSFNLDMIRSASRWEIAQSELPRQISIRLPLQDRREMGLRQDQTEVWLGTQSNFIPTSNSRAGLFRGDRADITSSGNGESLVPGATYFARFAERDIFGNLSQITGLNLASAATTPSFTVRYLTLTQSSLAVRTSTPVYNTSWNGFTPLFYNVDNGTDAAGKTHDNFNSYSITSSLFRAGCDGIYSAVGEVPWTTNKGGTVGGRVARFTGGMAFIGYSGLSVASFATAGLEVRLMVNETVYCSSGDFLRIEWDPGAAAAPVLAPTSSAAFGYVHFSLLNQR